MADALPPWLLAERFFAIAFAARSHAERRREAVAMTARRTLFRYRLPQLLETLPSRLLPLSPLRHIERHRLRHRERHRLRHTESPMCRAFPICSRHRLRHKLRHKLRHRVRHTIIIIKQKQKSARCVRACGAQRARDTHALHAPRALRARCAQHARAWVYTWGPDYRSAPAGRSLRVAA